MEKNLENFVFSGEVTDSTAFSVKGSLPSCNDSISLAMPKQKCGVFFTLRSSLAVSEWKLVSKKIRSLAFSVVNTFFCRAERVIRKVAAGMRFAFERQKIRKSRSALFATMALRL